MRQQIITTAIVLSRTDFQEADRILTLITPDRGKIRAIAKGVRRQKSKLAGGIELFSVSQITYLPGRGEIGTLVSTRLQSHFGNIVKEIERTMLGYDVLKRMNRLTEDATGEEYFSLLEKTLSGLNDLELNSELTELWLSMQLLFVTGHTPNLKKNATGNMLDAKKNYIFDFDSMAFSEQSAGPYDANHIKLLRLAYAADEPGVLKQVTDAQVYVPEMLQLAKNLLSRQVRV
jgi:DNA repair protein RecO (recombination protein O)